MDRQSVALTPLTGRHVGGSGLGLRRFLQLVPVPPDVFLGHLFLQGEVTVAADDPAECGAATAIQLQVVACALRAWFQFGAH